MSLLRLYFDEDAMDGDVVRGLRSRGIDVVTATDARMIRRPPVKVDRRNLARFS